MPTIRDRLSAAWEALNAGGEPAYRALPERVPRAVALHYDPTTAGGEYSLYTEPILQMTQHLPGSGLRHETQMLLWHAMRQYSPTLDAAIRNRRTLEGDAVVVSDDEGLAEMLNDFAETVPVGYLGEDAVLRGLNTYANMKAENCDEYGLSVGEIQADERGREIRRLVTPNMRTISMGDRDRDDIYELYQTQKNAAGGQRRVDNEPLVQVMSLSYATEGPWPCPLAWSAVKSTEVVMRMFESVANGWWRFGDPSLLLGMEFDKEANPETQSVAMPDGSSVSVPGALVLLKNTVEQVMQARRNGRVADAYSSIQGGKIINEVLGHIDQSLMRYFREQASVFDGHVIALSRTPIWMYPSQTMRGEGLGSNLANNEALIASVDAMKRNAIKGRVMMEVLDTHLILSGDARYVGKYNLEFEAASILDDKAQADAAKTQAEAEAAIIENVVQLYDEAGGRRFAGEAERMLEESGIYMETT